MQAIDFMYFFHILPGVAIFVAQLVEKAASLVMALFQIENAMTSDSLREGVPRPNEKAGPFETGFLGWVTQRFMHDPV